MWRLHASRAVLLAICAFPLLATPSVAASGGQQLAFLHEPHHDSHHGHHSKGCFVTTHDHHRARGIRHWRENCPHHDRKKLHHYEPHHHNRHHSEH